MPLRMIMFRHWNMLRYRLMGFPFFIHRDGLTIVMLIFLHHLTILFLVDLLYRVLYDLRHLIIFL